MRSRAASGFDRRSFLAATSASLTAALAGCGGGGDEGDGGDETDANGGETQTGETTGTGDDAPDFSGVSMDYWGIANVQSDAARERVEELIARFENQTGATININHSGYEQLQGANWIQAFERGEQPPVFDTETTYNGRFYENDFILPYNEYQAELDSEVNDSISWVFDTYELAMEGWEEEAFDLPWGFIPRNGMQVRADHMEEAGLDPDSDFPPENFDELASMAQTLQEDGPGQFGFQLFGDQFDWMHPIQSMIAAEDPAAAEFLNAEWDDVNFDNDQYIEKMNQAVQLYDEMGIGSPETPTMSDENTTDLMLQGQVSMSAVEWFNIPTILDRAPDLYESGDLRWGPFYGADSSSAMMGFYSVGLATQPENTDDQAWQRKREAGTALVNMWLDTWNQETAINTLGAFPVNDTVWEDTDLPGEENHNTLESAFTMAENAEAAWETHPAIATIKDTMGGAAAQDIYRGADVEDRMNQLAEDARAEL
jgi:hypothetical protein